MKLRRILLFILLFVFFRCTSFAYISPINSKGEPTNDSPNIQFRYGSSIFNHDALYGEIDETSLQIILNEAQNHEYIWIIPLLPKNSSVDELDKPEKVTVGCPLHSGISHEMGKDYRLFLLKNNELTEKEIYKVHTELIDFYIDCFGIYVIYYNPAAFNTTFYTEKPVYDVEHNILTEEYYKTADLKAKDFITFPEIPKKDGYVFTGWGHTRLIISSGYYDCEEYLKPQPITAINSSQIYPLWCPEEEYTPLEVTITSDKKIIKGQEDGAVLTLSLSEGKFSDEIPLEWRPVFDDEDKEDFMDEEYYQHSINSSLLWWKQYWNISGSDEVIIETVEKIDDRNLKLTLSGNSSDIYSDSEIKIEFDHSLYLSYFRDHENKIFCEQYDIQLDEDGVMKNKFITDNSITLHAQKKPSRGGSLRPVEVKADTDKSSEQDKVDITEENTDIKDTENVTDTNTEEPVSDTEASADNSAEESEKDASADNSIIFTIGSKTVSVSGEEKENDVAPVIRNGRTMLPARFVAEALGAVVNWDEISRTVTVTKDDIKIVITIDSQTAVVNGEEIKLDSPAFIESGRTYTPLRLIAESLGASVNWNEDAKTVTIKP